MALKRWRMAIETHLPLFHFQAFGPCSSISFNEAHVFLPLVLSLAIFCRNRSSTLLSSILSLSIDHHCFLLLSSPASARHFSVRVPLRGTNRPIPCNQRSRHWQQQSIYINSKQQLITTSWWCCKVPGSLVTGGRSTGSPERNTHTEITSWNWGRQ